MPFTYQQVERTQTVNRFIGDLRRQTYTFAAVAAAAAAAIQP